MSHKAEKMARGPLGLAQFCNSTKKLPAAGETRTRERWVPKTD